MSSLNAPLRRLFQNSAQLDVPDAPRKRGILFDGREWRLGRRAALDEDLSAEDVDHSRYWSAWALTGYGKPLTLPVSVPSA
jgi:hypothetical protein